MQEAPTIQLTESLSAKLVKPRTIFAVALARDEDQLLGMPDEELTALGMAALFMCWPADKAWPARPRPRPWEPGVKIAVYGGNVYDSLVEAGVDYVELITIGAKAYTWAVSTLPRRAAVMEAEGFSASSAEG